MSTWSKFSTPSEVSYDNDDSTSSTSSSLSNVSNVSNTSSLPQPFVSNEVDAQRNIRILIAISVLIGIGLGSYRLNKYIESIESKKGDEQKQYDNVYDYTKKEWKTKPWQSIAYLNIFLNAISQMILFLSSIFGILYFTMYLARKMAR
jgi:hypothetical protein